MSLAGFSFAQELDTDDYYSESDYLRSDRQVKEFDQAEWAAWKDRVLRKRDPNYDRPRQGMEHTPRRERAADPITVDEYQPRYNRRRNYGAQAPVTSDAREGAQRRGNTEPGTSMAGNVTLILLVVVLVGLVIFLFLKAPVERASPRITSIEEMEPTEIPKSELEILLEKAVMQKDYRAAVRIYFIYTIKTLMEQGLIEYHREKTNISYLREMRQHGEYEGFRDVVGLYEIVWYGEREVDDYDYQEIEPFFKGLITRLGGWK